MKKEEDERTDDDEEMDVGAMNKVTFLPSQMATI